MRYKPNFWHIFSNNEVVKQNLFSKYKKWELEANFVIICKDGVKIGIIIAGISIKCHEYQNVYKDYASNPKEILSNLGNWQQFKLYEIQVHSNSLRIIWAWNQPMNVKMKFYEYSKICTCIHIQIHTYEYWCTNLYQGGLSHRTANLVFDWPRQIKQCIQLKCGIFQGITIIFWTHLVYFYDNNL